MPEIIDFRITLPPREYADPSGEGDQRFSDSDYLANYNRIYTRERGGGPDAAAMIAAMSEAGVDRAVLQAEWAAGDYRAMNDAVHRIVAGYPDVLTGYVTVNPAAGDNMAAVVEEEVRERGAKGVNLQPFSYRVMANHKRFYPLYSKCQELGVPVTIHSSINFSNDRSIVYGRPIVLDEIACDFPDLTIVANHGGWPWVNELVAVAWKHRNVYIEIGAVAPKYIGTPGTGWETLMHYGNTSLLSDRVLFATDNMIPFDRAVRELQDLPLKDHVKEGWLGANAARLLSVVEDRLAAL
ncbi:MAG: amidohydrolase [Chloroflexi bacterium]|nr:amidohydrolase [Chloroflexota bacterium]